MLNKHMIAETIADILRAQADARPDAGFLHFHDGSGQVLSFAGTWQLASRWADLFAISVPRGRTVLLALPNSSDFAGAFFGSLIAGLVPAPCVPPNGRDPARFAEDIAARARLTDAAALVVPDRTAGAGDLIVLSARDLPASAPDRSPLVSDAPALRQFSSGTSTSLKAIELSHAALTYQARSLCHGLRADPARDVALSWLPWFHDMGLFGFLLAPTCAGVPAHILPTESFARRPGLWLEAVTRERATITAGPPSAFLMAGRIAERRNCAGLDLSGLRVALVGAERVMPSACARIVESLTPARLSPHALLCAYGLAEVGVTVTLSDPGSPVRESIALDQAHTSLGCGTALPGTEIKIAGPAGTELEDGRTGQILIRSPSLLTRYLTADGPVDPRGPDGWFPTRDVGHIEAGTLFVQGRSDDMIVIGGTKYAPEEFEEAARACGIALGEVAAISFPDERLGTDRAMVIVEVISAAHSGELAIKAVRQSLAARQLPLAEILVVDPRTIERTANGKLRRSQCRQMVQERYVDA